MSKLLLRKFTIVYAFLLIFLFKGTLYSQASQTSFEQTLSFRGLTQSDITIPVNFDKDKSPRNDSKLLLPVVKDLMQNPLRYSGLMDSMMALTEFKDDNRKLLNFFYTLLDGENFKLDLKILDKGIPIKETGEIIFDESVVNDLCDDIIKIIKNSKRENSLIYDKIKYSKEESDFIKKNLMSLISSTDDDERADNTNIFRYNATRDSSITTSKKTIDLLSKTDFNSILNTGMSDFIHCEKIFDRISCSEKNVVEMETEEIHNEYISGEFLFYYDEDGIRIAIGGKGKNIYTGKFDFIIDLGGEDVYDLKEDEIKISGNNLKCIIDLSGNDHYATKSNNCLAGAVFSNSFIFDKEGDDVYEGKNVTIGSAICGFGILTDLDGNDTYRANQFSIGSSSFGIGAVIDRKGNDVYIANSYSQGFGMTKGVGAIVDYTGNDNYLIDARSLDIGRYEDHYVSMCQGYGLGMRPYYAGGVGLIIEGEGNDVYSTDIFGQGGAYWYALGCIADKSGHDKYVSYQYAQGAGIHLAVGFLKDYDGWDFYSAVGVSQGCGHDYGVGILDDVKGNDNYSVYSLSQGAGNANGIGIFFDRSGRDGYLNKEPGNVRGYGNSRREYGSIGIFVDGSGDDFYSQPGPDSVIANTSMWGVFDDYYLKDLPSQASGNSYKVPLDSSVQYSQEQYFIMAKTIEPRFSLWQEYGFRKLADDSTGTPEFLLKYLDTDDHRDGLVLRNLSMKIGYTMGNFLTEKLRLYNNSMSISPVFNQNEVAFICYLFGETKNPAGKEELLQLTYDENIKVRTSAVNALGKINIDSVADVEFILKAASRLRELASEHSAYKLFNKDIAYAFKNYNNFDNIATLFNMTGNDYFGVRFVAAENLSIYGDQYYELLTDEKINEASGSPERLVPFLISIKNLKEEKYKSLTDRLIQMTNGEMDKMNIAEAVSRRSQNSDDETFKIWSEEVISKLQSSGFLKIK